MTGLGVLALVCSVFPVSPTTRTALLLTFSFALAFVVPMYVAIAIAVAIFALFVVDALVSAKKVSVKRNMPSQLARGVPSEYRIATAAASSPISKRSEKILAAKIRQPRCADVELTPQEATDDLTGTIVALRRGKHVVPPFATRVAGPFGLAMWHRPSTDDHVVHVYPDLPAAQRLAHSIQQGKFATAGLKRKGPLGLGTNFESVREYFPDDDSRLVNWSATARMGRPMSNQYRVEQDRDVMVLVDTGRLMTAPLPLDDVAEQKTHFATRLDFALDALCGIASVSDVMGDRVGVVTFDSRVRRHLKPRRAGAQAVIKTTYDIEPLPVDSDYDAAFQRVGRSKRSFVLVLTDFVDKRSAEPLVRALNIIKKKHRVVVASVMDSEVMHLLETPPARDDYLEASAREMARASQEAIGYIKKAGVEVIYSPHETYMVDCVKSYLQAKQRATI
jgi:uncharacterized protein (DUF58 family)